MRLTLEALEQDFSVCQCKEISAKEMRGDFYFISKTDGELSLVCETRHVPADVTAREDGWKAFRVQGVLDFSLTGILANLSGLLADSGIGIFAVSTYDTDYILTKKENFYKALTVLGNAGHVVTGAGE